MGIEFFPCSNCEEIFPDCGDFFNCDTCHYCFCSDDCGKRQETTDITTCILCRKESATERQLLNFLLTKFSLTFEEVLKQYQNEK